MADPKKGKQGFASMDEDKHKEIASKGGKTTHKSSGNDVDEGEDEDKNESSGKGKQGFASMDKDKQREIASKGGKSSHSGSGGNK
mgnify:CR=1 FL=1